MLHLLGMVLALAVIGPALGGHTTWHSVRDVNHLSRRAVRPDSFNGTAEMVTLDDQWTTTQAWFSMWVETRTFDDYKTDNKTCSTFDKCFQDSIKRFAVWDEFEPRECNLLQDCRPPQYLDYLPDQLDKLHAWRTLLVMGNINEMYRTQLEYLNVAITKSSDGSFEIIYNSLLTGLKVYPTDADTKPRLSTVNVVSILGASTQWVALFKKIPDAVVEYNDNKRQKILADLLNFDDPVYKADPELVAQMKRVAQADRTLAAAELLPDVNSNNVNDKNEAIKDAQNELRDALETEKRLKEEASARFGLKLDEDAIKADVRQKSVAAVLKKNDISATFKKWSKGLDAVLALAGTIFTTISVLESILAVYEPTPLPGIVGAEYKAMITTVWGGAVKKLEAGHARVFDEDPDLPNGLKSLFLSNQFNLRADWGKSQYTTTIDQMSRFLAGYMMQVFLRERYIFFKAYDSTRFGRENTCREQSNTYPTIYYCLPITDPVVNDDNSGKTHLWMISLSNYEFNHDETPDPYDGPDEAGYNRRDERAVNLNNLDEVDYAIQHDGLTIEDVFLSSIKCQYSRFAKRDWIERAWGEAGQGALPRYWNVLDGQGRPRTPWSFQSDIDEPINANLSATYGNWMYSSPGARNMNSTIEDTLCAFNVPVQTYEVNPVESVREFREGGSYAQSIIWSLVGNAANNTRMQWPKGLRGAKVRNPGWASEYNKWP